MMDTGRILGRGIAFPPRIGTDGRIAVSEGEQNIAESIRIVLGTEPGERLQLPDFGAGLGGSLFEPNNTATRHRIAERIRRAIADWEPRAAVQAVRVEPDPANPDAAAATVTYQLVATQTVANLAVTLVLRG